MGTGNTVPVIVKLNGFVVPTLVVKLMSPVKVPGVAVLNCTVKLSLFPPAIVPASGSMMV